MKLRLTKNDIMTKITSNNNSDQDVEKSNTVWLTLYQKITRLIVSENSYI